MRILTTLSGSRPLLGVCLALSATVVATVLAHLPLLETAEWKLYDQRLRWTANPSTAHPDIVVVAIDETSVRRLEPVVGRWPWPRLVHAHLVDFLREAGARVIAYDVLFTERDRRTGFDVGGDTWTGEESDAVFAESVKRAGSVVLLADVTYEGLEPEPGAGDAQSATADVPAADPTARPAEGMTLPRFSRPEVAADAEVEVRPTLLPPYPALNDAALALGHNLMIIDDDGPVRRVAPLVRVGGRAVPSLALATALTALGQPIANVNLAPNGLRVGDAVLPLTRERLAVFANASRDSTAMARRLLVSYRGPSVLADGRTTSFRQVSFYDVFYSREQQLAGETPLLDPTSFKDKVVIVGTTAAGLFDVFATPFGNTGAMPGAVVHGNVVDTILSKRALARASSTITLTATLLAAGGACAWLLGLGRRSLPLAAGAVAAWLLAFVALSVWLFGRGTWLPLVEPLLAVGLVFGGGYYLESREKRVVKQLFSRYLSRDVYQRLLTNPAAAELGGARREMTVLFSDVRGFTAMSEQGTPEEVVAQLNEYFSAMVDLVFANGGTVDKFVGDMVMALFGAPLDDERHAERAVRTAVAMVETLETLNEGWRAAGRPTLAIGIGINSGEMIAGNIGSERIRSYTVIGDAVNLGSRLESLNKEKGTSIIISEATARRVQGQFDLRPLGNVVVRGRQQPVTIFEVRVPTRAREDARASSSGSEGLTT